ncbi:Afb1p NDAI_0E01770 [Naumovozyma dairenensis CBS 421]|uniref:Uncharacterized protein n=1 Tax=Naumovozyma dairenensis (strain ATCC 10597 / BCRC 20456 / CBS 421 / NBRC 0211 / NRRL Y-12639) TaxID=1071378 RepID=G0WB73_NAUDC|nr:hypothetical protein NDAI_0E01770 [Naumovozyma dairenensis CBS 421]CCD24993.1 hypothetical protein NDAI_0E01770 [Naumovozyma dairenensis CBS 421]
MQTIHDLFQIITIWTICCIGILKVQAASVTKTSTNGATNTVTSFASQTITNSAQMVSARSEAANVDMPFFMAFLDDFGSQLPQYTSYMAQNHFTLPQAIADYYYHIAFLPDTADLQADIANTFPFNQFQTFITAFPWYSSLLSHASVSTIYLPEDFIENTAINNASIIQTSSSLDAPSSSITSRKASSTISSKSITSSPSSSSFVTTSTTTTTTSSSTTRSNNAANNELKVLNPTIMLLLIGLFL